MQIDYWSKCGGYLMAEFMPNRKPLKAAEIRQAETESEVHIPVDEPAVLADSLGTGDFRGNGVRSCPDVRHSPD
jgi:hypothetical protein